MYSAKWGIVDSEDNIAASKVRDKITTKLHEMIFKIIDVNDEDYYLEISNLAHEQIVAIFRYFLYAPVAPSAELLIDIWEHGCICLGWIGTWPTPGHPLVITEIDPTRRLAK
jgi:hypothetical protein